MNFSIRQQTPIVTSTTDIDFRVSRRVTIFLRSARSSVGLRFKIKFATQQ